MSNDFDPYRGVFNQQQLTPPVRQPAPVPAPAPPQAAPRWGEAYADQAPRHDAPWHDAGSHQPHGVWPEGDVAVGPRNGGLPTGSATDGGYGGLPNTGGQPARNGHGGHLNGGQVGGAAAHGPEPLVSAAQSLHSDAVAPAGDGPHPLQSGEWLPTPQDDGVIEGDGAGWPQQGWADGYWAHEPIYVEDTAPQPGYPAAGYREADLSGADLFQPDPQPAYVPAARPPAPRPPAAPVLYGRAAPPAVRQSIYTPVELENLDVRGKAVPAKQGWRGMVHSLTKINVAPGPDEIYEIGLKERVQRIVRTTFPIAVVGVKGGVGKTVVVEALGSTFSTVRGDRVIAVDLDPDAGNLTARHGRETALSIVDLVADTSMTRYMDVRAHTNQNKASRLEVLSGADYAATTMPLRRDEVEAVMPILSEHYSLVLMDTGCGLKTNVMTSILGHARALVIVSSASIDALEETQVTLEWLRNNGYQHLLESAVLVINQTQRGKAKVDVNKAVEQFSRQIAPERIFVCPFDDHVDEGKRITLELMSAASRRRYLEIAAAIADLVPLIGD